jgi:retron-type reverse transcriptase
MYSYLSERKQCVKVGVDFSAWKNIYKGVPQVSILDPVLFNIFVNDIFNFVEESILYNYADWICFHLVVGKPMDIKFKLSFSKISTTLFNSVSEYDNVLSSA